MHWVSKVQEMLATDPPPYTGLRRARKPDLLVEDFHLEMRQLKVRQVWLFRGDELALVPP